MRRLFNLILLVLALLPALSATAQYQKLWGVPGQGIWGNYPTLAADFDLLCPGYYTADGFMARMDTNGVIRWARSYTFGPVVYDELFYAAENGVGDIVTAGWYGGNGNDLLAMKLNPATGTPIWTNAYGSTGSERGFYGMRDGNDFYIVGESNTRLGSQSDFLVTKIDASTGAQLWSRYYEVSGAFYNDAYARGICKASNGNIMVVGAAWSTNGREEDVILMQLNPANGNVVWSRMYAVNGAVREWITNIIPTSSGEYLLTGYAADLSGYNDMLMIKVNSSGILQWGRRVQGMYSWDPDWGIGSIETADGNYLAALESDVYTFGDNDAYLVKMSPSGNLQWARHYGTTGALEDGFHGAVEVPGGYLAMGWYSSTIGVSFDMVVVKTDQNGLAGCAEASVSPAVNAHNMVSQDITGSTTSGNMGARTAITATSTVINLTEDNLCTVLDSETPEIRGIATAAGNLIEWNYEVSPAERLFIERSSDGRFFGPWLDLAQSTNGEYAVWDRRPFWEESFYRLAVTNADGSTRYSGVLALSVAGKPQAWTWPVPANEALHIRAAKAIATMSIHDATGRSISLKLSTLSPNEYRLETHEIPDGIYFLKLNLEDGSTVLRTVRIAH